MKALKIIFFVILATLLSGCFTGIVYQADAEIQKPGARISLLNKQLIAYDIGILKDVDSMVLVLPNKKLFNANSANFTQEAYKILDLILELTSYYEKSVISVKGVAGAGITMTAGRAHKVVQYLWRSGIDASFMYADSNNAILIKNKKLFLTDCIVISFRKLN
jgi:hypothetical protein